MKQTTYSTVAFLSPCNHQKPSLEIKGTIPTKYTEMIITDYTFGEIVVPEGFDEAGLPYFSDEFYQKLRTEYDDIVKYDKERARNLFWFNVSFVNCTM
mgnify:CR=1 FL=1